MANDSMKKELVYPRLEENADRKQLLRELLKGNAAPLPILSASVFSPHILLRGESDD